MSNPPDQWQKIQLAAPPSSDAILSILNTQAKQVTAAFVQLCSDGWFLFLGFYSKG